MENEPNPEVESDSSQIANILRGYGKEHGFDSETCDEIATMDFQDAFEATYGYLTQAGLEPDDILASFMEEPSEE